MWIESILKFTFAPIIVSLLLALVYVVSIRYSIGRKREIIKDKLAIEDKKIIAFYHPFTNACGGGEKVLFMMLQSISDLVTDENSYIIIYTVEELDAQSIIAKAQQRFEFRIKIEFRLLRIKKRYFTDLTKMVKLQLISQAIGSIVSVFDAIYTFPPDVFIDTIGASWSYPLVKFMVPGVKIISYTHYPFIQEDMLELAHTQTKRIYYHILIFLFSFVGYFADLIMVNSTWTKRHIDRIWNCPNNTHIVFPPCNVKRFSQISLDTPKKDIVVSFAQFRPEKNHELQIYSFLRALK